LACEPSRGGGAGARGVAAGVGLELECGSGASGGMTGGSRPSAAARAWAAAGPEASCAGCCGANWTGPNGAKQAKRSSGERLQKKK
jgi:hypothetical protein